MTLLLSPKKRYRPRFRVKIVYIKSAVYGGKWQW